MPSARKKRNESVTTLAEALCQVCRLFGDRQWCLATSGNFSARIDDGSFLITESGKDKSRLSPGDLMIYDIGQGPRDSTLKPSAETALHLCLFQHDAEIGAVFHTHSSTSTVLSRSEASSFDFSGYEMQKALRGVHSHENRVSLPVLENSQDMPALAETLRVLLASKSFPVPGFLIRGHGLYAWGRDLSEARRHIEGLEFLLSCEWLQKTAAAR
jgi:methylthioribulose-1-phosphate dehydratase